jgi:energy-coupling factor transporter ATP-binding protein EcfA2
VWISTWRGGSIVALLGSNGAGKTPILRILSTLLKADAGTANVNDFDVATQPADVWEGHQNLQHGVITLLHNAQLHEHQPRPLPRRRSSHEPNQERDCYPSGKASALRISRSQTMLRYRCRVPGAGAGCRCLVPVSSFT